MRRLFVAFFLTIPTAALAGQTVQYTTGPVAMKPSEIRAYNSHLPKDHPNYIRCKRELETGSLVKRISTCRTNEEWNRVETQANNEARDTVREMQKGSSSGN